jgi:PAS domain S-box-containing protein
MANEASISFSTPIRDAAANKFFISLNPHLIFAALLTSVGYYVGSLIGFTLTFQPHPVSVLWPPNSILLAALLLTPPRAWGILLLATLPAHIVSQFQSHIPLSMMFCYFISNSCEAIIGAAGTRYFIGGQVRFDSLRNTAIFCIFGALIGPFLSSFLDAGFVQLNHWGAGHYWEIWRIRFFSNVLTALTFAPAIVIWFTQSDRGPKRDFKYWMEPSLLFLGLVGVCYAALYVEDSPAEPAWFCAPIPFLLWAALRLGGRGTSSAILIVTCLAIWSAAHGHGPFTADSPEKNARSIQLFLIVTAVPFLFLAGVVEERAKRETDLRESEDRFRILADTAPVMVWMSGPDKLCTFFNRAWLEFRGRQIEEELGNRWSEGVHPDDFEQCLATYIRAFDARQPFTMQYRLRRRDGEYRYVSDEGVPRYGRWGEFVGYIGACVDVSDILKKEQQLHESEERVSLATEAVHLGIWELDNTTGTVWMSDIARELFQFDCDARVNYADLQGRLHPDDRARHEAAVKHAIQTRANYEIEYRVLLPSGAQRWIVGRGRCVPDANGKFTRLLGVSADTTERKQAQELFRIATEASPNGILLVNGNGDIVLVNAHVEELFGYHRDELLGKPIATLLAEGLVVNDARSGEPVFAISKNGISDRAGEFIARRKDGTEFPIEIDFNPVESPDGLLILASVVDLSERKRAEEEAKHRRDEISRLQRIGLLAEMTASIGHEINQPLSGIIMNAGTALRYLEQPHIELRELREMLTDVQADAHRAHRVVRNIRETVRKGGAVRQRVAINEVVRGVMHMVQPEAAVHSCELEASLGNDLPFVAADPVQIQQVLINLLANAFDAVQEMPSHRRKVEITTENGSDEVRVTVRDHGTGIAEEARERLFDQFFTTKAQGVGMGLAIVWSIIDAHSGRISAENVDGEGAQFTFSLPVSDPTAK